MKCPRVLQPRPLLISSLVFVGLGVVVLGASPLTFSGAVLGLVMRTLGFILGFFSIGVALSRVMDMRTVAMGVSLAVLAASCIAAVIPAPDLRVSLVLDATLTVCTLMLTWKTVEPILASIAQGPGVEVEALANPRSYLLPNHRLFLLMLIFSVAVGFGSSLRIDGFTPLTNNLSIVALVCVTVWFLLTCFIRGNGHEDTLLTLAILLVISGFLAAPIEVIDSGMANALLYAGRLAFGILSWSALAALCGRNPAGSVMVLACSEVASGVGACMGFELGHACNALLVNHPWSVSMATSATVLLLSAYVLLGLRGFSIAETIRGVEPVAPLPAPEEAALLREKPLDAACRRIGEERDLTNREREVLAMLARGHNGYHVRDALNLSYNTVKTHVKRVYFKLDVHSQQELIDLVERETETG